MLQPCSHGTCPKHVLPQTLPCRTLPLRKRGTMSELFGAGPVVEVGTTGRTGFYSGKGSKDTRKILPDFEQEMAMLSNFVPSRTVSKVRRSVGKSDGGHTLHVDEDATLKSSARTSSTDPAVKKLEKQVGDLVQLVGVLAASISKKS